MNRKEYIAALEKQLLRLPKSDRDDILNDFETHFDNETASGLTEEEISAQLGDPAELAAVYLDNLPEGSKGAQFIPETVTNNETASADTAQPQPQAYPVYAVPRVALNNQPVSDKAKRYNTENLVVYILMCIFAFVPIASTIVGIVFGIMGAAVGCGIGSVALMVIGGIGISSSVVGGIGLILIGVAVLMLAALFVVGTIAAIKGVIMLVTWFVKWSKEFLAPVN